MVASAIESTIAVDGNALVRSCGGEELRVEPWGASSVRVRVSLGRRDEADEALGALLPTGQVGGKATVDDEGGQLVVGDLTVVLGLDGQLAFLRTDDGTELLAEEAIHFWWPGPRNFSATGNG